MIWQLYKNIYRTQEAGISKMSEVIRGVQKIVKEIFLCTFFHHTLNVVHRIVFLTYFSVYCL